MSRPEVERRLGPLLLNGELARCGVVNLEVLFSARNHAELVQTRAELRALPLIATEERDFERAADVMELLSKRGHHRGPGIPDLLIAAIAERAKVTVLHYDQDFDLIASVTRQPVQWVVPRGSVA